MDLDIFPIEVTFIIKSYIIYIPMSKIELKIAIDLWCNNYEKAIEKYGHITLWNTKNITNMDNLFHSKHKFNNDISSWNVKNVTSMRLMFFDNYYFNQNLNRWNVSNVKDMYGMFCGCHIYNKPMNKWNVTKVSNMKSMFSFTNSLI